MVKLGLCGLRGGRDQGSSSGLSGAPDSEKPAQEPGVFLMGRGNVLLCQLCCGGPGPCGQDMGSGRSQI